MGWIDKKKLKDEVDAYRFQQAFTEYGHADDGLTVSRTYRDIIERQAEVERPGWIPCKDKQPDRDGSYLISDSQGYVYVAYCEADEEYWWTRPGIEVRAWQPLPTPYREVRR